MQTQSPNPSQRRDLLRLRKLKRWRRPSLRRKRQMLPLRTAKPKLTMRHQLQKQATRKRRQQNNISQTTSFISAPCTSFSCTIQGNIFINYFLNTGFLVV